MISVSSGCAAAVGGLMALGSSVGMPVAVVGASPLAAVAAVDVLSRRTVEGSQDCELVTVRSGAMLVTPSLGVTMELVAVGSVPLLEKLVVMGGGITVGEVVGVVVMIPVSLCVVMVGLSVGPVGPVVLVVIGGGSTTVMVGLVVGGSGGGGVVVSVTIGGSVVIGLVPVGVTVPSVTSGMGMMVEVGISGNVVFGRGRALVRISSISLNRELRGSVLLVVGSGAGVVAGASVVMAVVGNKMILDVVGIVTGSATETTVEAAWELESVRASVVVASVVSLGFSAVELLLGAIVGAEKGVVWMTCPLDATVLDPEGKRFPSTPSTISLRDCFVVAVVAWDESVSIVVVTSSGATVMLVN